MNTSRCFLLSRASPGQYQYLPRSSSFTSIKELGCSKFPEYRLWMESLLYKVAVFPKINLDGDWRILSLMGPRKESPQRKSDFPWPRSIEMLPSAPDIPIGFAGNSRSVNAESTAMVSFTST